MCEEFVPGGTELVELAAVAFFNRLENVDEKVEDACVEDIYVVCGVFVILDY